MAVLITLKAKEVEGGKPHKFSILASPTEIDPSDIQALQDLWKSPAVLKEKQQTVIEVKFAEGEERKIEESDADQIMMSMRMSRVAQESAEKAVAEQPKPTLPEALNTIQSVSERVYSPTEVSGTQIEAEKPSSKPAFSPLPKHDLSPLAVFCLIASVVTALILLLKLLGH